MMALGGDGLKERFSRKVASSQYTTYVERNQDIP